MSDRKGISYCSEDKFPRGAVRKARIAGLEGGIWTDRHELLHLLLLDALLELSLLLLVETIRTLSVNVE